MHWLPGGLGNLCNWQQHIANLIIEKPIARGVYEITIPSSEIHDDFEYFLFCTDKAGKTFLWTATAGKNNQSVLLN